MWFALLTLITVSITVSSAQELRHQVDLPESRPGLVYSKQRLRDEQLNMEIGKKALREGANIFFDYDYYVYPVTGGEPTHWKYREKYRESSTAENTLVISISGSFLENGDLAISGMQSKREYMKTPAGEPALISVPMAASSQSVPAPPVKPTAAKDPASTQPEQEDSHASEIKTLEIQIQQDEASLKKVKKTLNRTLLFPIPEEEHVTFMIDGSDSIAQPTPEGDMRFSNLAIAQLDLTLSLLKPNQRFSLGVTTDDGNGIFNSGVEVTPTRQNRERAIEWLFNAVKYPGSSEDFAVLFRKLPPSPHVYIYTDGQVDDRPTLLQECLQLAKKHHSVVEIAPIVNDNYDRLKRSNYAHSEATANYDNPRFIPDLTSKTGGKILPEITRYPNEALAKQYKELMKRIASNHAKLKTLQK